MEVSEKLINESVAAHRLRRAATSGTSSSKLVVTSSTSALVAEMVRCELPAPHRRSSTPRSEVATEHEKKREKNERHGEKLKTEKISPTNHNTMSAHI